MTAKRRPSKAVYRRRRLVVGILTLVLLAAAVVGVVIGIRWFAEAKPWENLPFVGGDDDPVEVLEEDPVPTIYPTAGPRTDDPSATETPEPEEPEACVGGALELIALTDKGEYGGDEQPKLSMELTNVGGVDCIVNVGTSAQYFEVASGADVWWRSNDCQQDPQDMWVTLEAGQTVKSEDPLTWNRSRSYGDTCDATQRPPAVGGGATYTLTVYLGELASQPTSFILH